MPHLPRLRVAARALALVTITFATITMAMADVPLLLFLLPDLPDPGPCDYKTLARLPSPESGWIAELGEEHCPAAMGGDTYKGVITLASRDDPKHATYVLATDTGGDPDERPRPVWTAPHVLQVTVYARSFLSLMTRQVGPIHIDLRFDPPDPAARTEFLHEMHMHPQPGE